MLTLLLAVCAAMVHGQTGSTGRIVGRVTDPAGDALPGVAVLLTGVIPPQTAVTDSDGRYAFEVDANAERTLTAAFSGFVTAVRERIVTAPGQTTIVDLSLFLGCLDRAIADSGQLPPLMSLVQSDAIVHIRVTNASVERRRASDGSDCPLSDSPATILGVAHLSERVERSNGPLLIAHGGNSLLQGAEYLVILSAGGRFPGTFISTSWDIVDGRVRTNDHDELGLRDGMPADRALRRLRELYRRHTRYRNDYRHAPTNGLEALRFKTGWVHLGTLPPDRDVWTWASEDGSYHHEPPFEGVSGEAATSGEVIPRRGDRIRLKEGRDVMILSYGSRGEANRLVPPSNRWFGSDLLDYMTGLRAWAGPVYTVAEVHVDSSLEGRTVDVRLAAIP